MNTRLMSWGRYVTSLSKQLKQQIWVSVADNGSFVITFGRIPNRRNLICFVSGRYITRIRIQPAIKSTDGTTYCVPSVNSYHIHT